MLVIEKQRGGLFGGKKGGSMEGKEWGNRGEEQKEQCIMTYTMKMTQRSHYYLLCQFKELLVKWLLLEHKVSPLCECYSSQCSFV